MLKLLVVVFSFVAGGVYYFAKDTAFWPAFVSIVMVANTVFLFVIEPAERSEIISKAQ